MKLIQLKCPNCGGKLDIDIDDKKMYCPYCGQKMMIDYEQMSKFYIEKENTKQEQEKTKRVQIETDYKKKRLNLISILCYVVIIVGIILGSIFVLSQRYMKKNPTKQTSSNQEYETEKNNDTQTTTKRSSVEEENNNDSTVTTTYKNVTKEPVTEIASEIPNDFDLSIASFDGSDFDEIYKDGTYKIGIDMPAGKYGAFNNGHGTGYANLYSDSNKTETLEGSGWSNYFCFVTAQEGQLLEIRGLTLVPYASIEAKGPENFGIFTGGSTLPVGEYYLTKLDTNKSGLYSIYSDTTESDVIEFNYYVESAFLTVQEGEIVVLQNTKAVKAPENPVNTNTVSKDAFETVYTQNMYRVGIDIEAGIYVAYGPQKWTAEINIKKDSCATKNITKNYLNCCSILQLENGIVDVRQEAYLVKYEDIKVMPADVTGIYKVGEDIDVGEYKVIPDASDNSHYWAIYDNNTLLLNKQNYINGNDYVTLDENQIFIIQNATYEAQ